jgi:proteic killer suppression protein
MNYELKFSEHYTKQAIKFFKLHSDIYEKYEKIIWLLADNPHHPSFRLHKLEGKMRDYHSVSINMRYRIVIDFIINDKEIILLNIGTHDDVYR